MKSTATIIREFCTDYAQWLDRVNSPWYGIARIKYWMSPSFPKTTGMCEALDQYLRKWYPSKTYQQRNEVIWKFKDVLSEIYGTFTYPFDATWTTYEKECHNRAIHLNTKRREFANLMRSDK